MGPIMDFSMQQHLKKSHEAMRKVREVKPVPKLVGNAKNENERFCVNCKKYFPIEQTKFRQVEGRRDRRLCIPCWNRITFNTGRIKT